MAKHALAPGSPEARARRLALARLLPGHLLAAIPVICPVALARQGAADHAGVSYVAACLLLAVLMMIVTTSVNYAAKMASARRTRPRPAWQYLLLAGAFSAGVAVCVVLLIGMAARHPDGWQPAVLFCAGLECLVAALVMAGRALGRGRMLRWLWLHHPAHMARGG